jgi:pimeloyl-ACP methyl ester carboxylesterase
LATRGVRSFMTYGISSGALRAALFAQRHPERVSRLALDAFVWTGAGAPTLEQRRKKLPEFTANKRRPIDRAFVHSIFNRDHPDCADKATVEAFADAILALDDSCPTAPTSTCARSCRWSTRRRSPVPTLVMRGQFDGIAAMDDLIEFTSAGIGAGSCGSPAAPRGGRAGARRRSRWRRAPPAPRGAG